MADAVASPSDGRTKILCRHVREQVPRDGDEQVRRQIGVLSGLVVKQIVLVGDAQTSLAQLLVGQLARHWHLGHGTLQRVLDGYEYVLDVPRQMPEPRVHPIADIRGGAVHRNQHGARPLVGLTLLALLRRELLIVLVPGPIPLEQECGGHLQLIAQDLFAPHAHLLDSRVDHALHCQLGLKSAPIPLQLQHGGMHVLDIQPIHHASEVALDGQSPADSCPKDLASGHTAHQGLDPRNFAIVSEHPPSAEDEASKKSLDHTDRLPHELDAAPSSDATECRLELCQILQHQAVLLARQVPFPDALDLREVQIQLDLIGPRLVLAVPTLQHRRILAAGAVHFHHVPHQDRLLDHDGGPRLTPDGFPSECPSDVPLNDGQRLLLVCLRQNVACIVRNHICCEVVIVALNAGSQPGRLQSFQVPMLLRRLPQGRVEGVGVEVQPRVAVTRAVFVGLIVTRKETAAVREAGVEQGEELPEAIGFGGLEVAASGHRHRPMFLAALGLVTMQVARCAEVVRALVAPNHGVRQTALAALHLHEASVIPKEFVGLAILEMLPEASDHRVDRLQTIGGQVKVPARVVADDHLPILCHGVPQREEAIPVACWVFSYAQLSRHVLDHLRRDQGLLHVVRIPTAAQEDAHCTEAAQSIRDRQDVQDVRRCRPLLGQPQLVQAHVEVIAFLQARLHEEVVFRLDGLSLRLTHLSFLVSGVELGLCFRAECEVG
mmetsp:Transcript_150399/g.483353  ORF Transcript_150399/g.483353 Transcript_150399/m.483353 type:complete len:719 (+) Transcript_150399:1529-3685(+)